MSYFFIYCKLLWVIFSRLMPESALTAPKDKKLTGRQWFESGRASTVTVPHSSILCVTLLLTICTHHID